MDPTSISFALLFKAPTILESLAAMLGLIESANKKLDKLIASEFDIGVRHLQELSVASMQNDFLLKEAWKRFEGAVTLEVGERKALAYIGLAFSQYHLGEKKSAFATLTELIEYNYEDKKERLKKTAIDVSLTTAAACVPAVAFVSFPVLLAGYVMARQLNINAAQVSAIYREYRKWTENVPSEQRIQLLKEQAELFLVEERNGE